MSDLHIALVAEGQLMEHHVIEAALKAILAPRTFVLNRLQPEESSPKLGAGWGGVLKWCDATAARHAGPLNTDPTLSSFDAVIVHLDADVAGFDYANLGRVSWLEYVATKQWRPLPCANPCPPPEPAASALHGVLLSWLNPASLGPTGIICLPAMNTGAWLAAANLPSDHELLQGLECNADIEGELSRLPLRFRINKAKRDNVLAKAPAVTARWTCVTQHCSRVASFEAAVRAVFL